MTATFDPARHRAAVEDARWAALYTLRKGDAIRELIADLEDAQALDETTAGPVTEIARATDQALGYLRLAVDAARRAPTT